MYKRTLYISEDTQSKIDHIATSENKTKAEVLRQAVDMGLKYMINPSPIAEKQPPQKPIYYQEKKPTIISSQEHESDPQKSDDVLTRILRLILK